MTKTHVVQHRGISTPTPMDPSHSSADSPAAAASRRSLWAYLLDGFASFQLFPSPPRRSEAADPWPEIWQDIRSDWEAIGGDLRNAARRHTT